MVVTLHGLDMDVCATPERRGDFGGIRNQSTRYETFQLDTVKCVALIYGRINQLLHHELSLHRCRGTIQAEGTSTNA